MTQQQRWITTENDQKVLIGEDGTIHAGLGGKFTGRKLGAWNKPNAPQQQTQKTATGAAPGGETSPRHEPLNHRSFVDGSAFIRQWEEATRKLEEQEAAKPDPKEHPLHHSKLPPLIQRELLKWHSDAHKVVGSLGVRAQGAERAGADVKKSKAEAFGQIDPNELKRLSESLKSVMAMADSEGVSLRPFVKHNRLVPRDLAARLKPDDTLFDPVTDEERFSAMFSEVWRECYAANHSATL